MRRKRSVTYFAIFFVLLAILSIPKINVERLQGMTIALFASSWQKLGSLKSFILRQSDEKNASLSQEGKEELEQLQFENTLLQAEILNLKEMVEHELKLIRFSFLNHSEGMPQLAQLPSKAVRAKIIFRSFSSWNSFFWIDVGDLTNALLDAEVIAKNSPVLIGTSIIGVIDFVGKKQSRVRLITDSGLSPSVRALRGSSQNLLIFEKIRALLHLLEKNHDTAISPIQGELVASLNKALSHLSNMESPTHSLYLAKGEIHGSSKPLWRTQRHLLQGTGFNYDYADGEGPARDLRTGQPLDPHSALSTIPIIKTGDLLVTTGMDGVFPPNLFVAEVTNVHTLKEGDYFYELEAQPTAGNLDELTYVFVIPPVGYQSLESISF